MQSKILSNYKGHPIPHPAGNPAEYASTSSAIQPLLSALIPLSPEWLAQHCYMLLASSLLCMKKAFKNSLGAEAFKIQLVCLPHSCRSTTGQRRRNREEPFIWGFFFLPSISPGTRGYHILLKRASGLIEHSAFGMGAERVTMAFLKVILAPLPQATGSHAPT